MIGRRGVLALGALGVAAGMSRAGLQSVAVIGAGMAGLAAASALRAAGVAVTVYEARGRIGGRVVTDRGWPGLPVDMGASWIHGVKGNPITALARAAGAALHPTDYDSGATFRDGAEAADLPDPFDLLDAAQAAAWDAATDLSLRAAVEGLAVWQAMGARGRDRMRAAIYRNVELEYAADWGALSARNFDAGGEFGGGDALLLAGYDALAAHAARGLDIRLGARVQRLEAGARGVRLGLAGGGVVTADAAVCTLPLGVLQAGAVVFDPPLAPARQAAIARLGMGLLNKLWLRFDAPPPVPPVDWLTDLTPPDDLWPEWVNPGARTGLPLLLGFNAAGRAAAVEGWSDADTIAAGTETLRAMFGSRFPAPRDGKVTRWRGDALAGGAYSFVPVGADGDTRAALAGTDWDGRLHFAGEAAETEHPATVHGAWLSGRRAAAALLE